jgi:hypothetical protein
VFGAPEEDLVLALDETLAEVPEKNLPATARTGAAADKKDFHLTNKKNSNR